jgi:phospholipase C
VRTLVISPFSRGVHVNSDTFDHTSRLRFLERRFGIEAPNISAWWRKTVGDLTSTLDFGSPDFSAFVPPSLVEQQRHLADWCRQPVTRGGPRSRTPFKITVPQTMPPQEKQQI